MNWWILKRRPHVSWLIATLSVALLMGVFLAKFTHPTQFASLTWCTIGLLLSGLGLWRRYIYLVPLLIVGGGIIGLWRGSIQTIELADVQKLYNTTVIVTGNVREDVDTNTAGRLIIRLDRLHIKNRSIAGVLWVSAKSSLDIKRSDMIIVEGKVSEGFGSFAGTVYQAKIANVQRPQPGDIARVVRDWFADGVRRAIPDPQASLGIGYLVGQKRALPADLVEALQIVGLTHVVVASGYNLTILVRLARRLFEKVSKYLSALSAATMIACFVAVTGLSPSMSRAALVAGLSLAAWYYGRRFHPLILLPFAAAVTVVINPSYIWGDIGWQLSFAAFAGVMILAPLLQRFFFGEKKPNFLRQILGETISATIVTAPILISAFGQISNVAILANLLVLPLVPLAMLLTFIAGVGALALPSIVTVVGLPASWLLGYMTNVTQQLSQLPFAVTKVEIPPVVAGIAYVVLVGVCIYLWRVTKFDLTQTNIVE
jgi:competence protein ComEC